MALITCHECGKEISSEAASCPHCGAKPKAPGSGSPWGWVLLFVGILVVIGIVAVPKAPGTDEKFKMKSAIELCWSEQQKKSLAPAEQRSIASVCERMETDFQTKFGHRP